MNVNQISGTIGGTFLSIVGIVDWSNLFKTTLLAAVGAIVSFLISAMMKYLFCEILNDQDQKKKNK